VKKTRKDLADVGDPQIIKKCNEALTAKILALEEQFGYNEKPRRRVKHERNELIKQGKDNYGVTISFEYKKALLSKHLHSSSSESLSEHELVPSNAFTKIKKTSDVVFKTVKSMKSPRREAAPGDLSTNQRLLQYF